MGCCISRPHNEDSPPGNAGPADRSSDTHQLASTSSLLEVNPSDQQARIQRNIRALRESRARAPKALQAPSASTKIKAPLLALPNGEPKAVSNMAMLRKAREEFFETRVTGRPEMWNVMQTTCRLMQEGAIEDAQAMLDAAGGSCPTGQLWGSKGGCYDDRGQRYVVPVWCIACPDGVDRADDSEEPLEGALEKENAAADQEATDDLEGSVKEGKGKGKMVTPSFEIKGQEVTVKVRYSHTAYDDSFVIGDQNTLDMLAQMAAQRAEIPHGTKVRLVYLGRLLEPRRSVADLSLKDDSVLSLFVFQ